MFDSEGFDVQDRALRDHVKGSINVSKEQIVKNLRANIKLHLPQAQGCPIQKDAQVMLICGGPSAYDLLPEIKKRRKRGWKLVTVNGAHDWVIENGMQPSAHVMLDARPWNARFVQNPVPGCRYLISSQCDPSVFKALENNDVIIWHSIGDKEKPILNKYYHGRYCAIPGASTVGSRAIPLFYMLGFRKIAIYGMDSCVKKDRHHSYAQPENDQEYVYVIRVGRRKFLAHPWMTVQADELLQMLPTLADDIKLDFRGDNMISYIIRYIAENRKVPKLKIVSEVKI